MIDELCNMQGVSGYESGVVQYIYDKLKGQELDKIYKDNVGNLVCFRKGTVGEQKVMITAHTDEVGFQVISKIDDEKYRIKSLGNVKTWNAYQQRVSSNQTAGVIYADNEDNLNAHNYENLYIRKLGGRDICVGDVFSFEGYFRETESYYYGKALDNRIACYILIDFIEKKIETKADLYIIFSVQEEVNMRGYRVAKSSIVPDICINIDASAVCNMNSLHLSEGVGISVSDSINIYDSEMVEWAKRIADAEKINYQIEVSDCGTNELIISSEVDHGAKILGLSIPCCSLHSSNSIMAINDVKECSALLSSLIRNI